MAEFPGGKSTGRKESRSALRPSRCFIKTRCGAIVREGAGFASGLVAELPYRVVVTCVGVAENANGARVRITAPVNGWVSYKNIELYPTTARARCGSVGVVLFCSGLFWSLSWVGVEGVWCVWRATPPSVP